MRKYIIRYRIKGYKAVNKHTVYSPYPPTPDQAIKLIPLDESFANTIEVISISAV